MTVFICDVLFQPPVSLPDHRSLSDLYSSVDVSRKSRSATASTPYATTTRPPSSSRARRRTLERKNKKNPTEDSIGDADLSSTSG